MLHRPLNRCRRSCSSPMHPPTPFTHSIISLLNISESNSLLGMPNGSCPAWQRCSRRRGGWRRRAGGAAAAPAGHSRTLCCGCSGAACCRHPCVAALARQRARQAIPLSEGVRALMTTQLRCLTVHSFDQLGMEAPQRELWVSSERLAPMQRQGSRSMPRHTCRLA